MPNISMTLPEVSQSVSRPIIYDIISQLQHITKISPDTKILYPGDISFVQTPGTNIDEPHKRDPMFNSTRLTFIEVDEDYDHNTLGSTAVTSQEHIPVFKDTSLSTHIAPVYATSQVSINFKYRTVSKTEALRWRDDMRIRISQMRDINLHSITYHYPLPVEILEIISAIHGNREAYLGYGQTLPEYITSYATDRLVLITDQINAHGRLVISETQFRIVGMFDYDAIPDKPERDDQTGTWSVQFTYKFSYEKPVGIHMRYPIMVHNELLPSKYIEFTNQDYKLEAHDRAYMKSLDALSIFETDNIMDRVRRPDLVLRIPDFDDFTPTQVLPYTASVFIALCGVDTEDRHTLMDLHELGDYVIDPDILEFIVKSEYPYIHMPCKSIINLSLYREQYLASPDMSLTCDAQGIIKSVRECDLRRVHRVRLSIVTDITILDRAALERLRRYPSAMIKLIGSINELIRTHPDSTVVTQQPYVTDLDFDPIYNILTGYDWVGQTGGGIYTDPASKRNYPCSTLQNGKFRGIDTRTVAKYRQLQTSMKTVLIHGVMAFRRDLSEDSQLKDWWHTKNPC